MDHKRILQLYYTNGFSGREYAAGTGDRKTVVNEFLRWSRECNELHYTHCRMVSPTSTLRAYVRM